MIRFISYTLGLYLIASTAYAGHAGITLSGVVIGKDPDNLHTYRGALSYQPDALIWKKFDVYFAASAGHWWSEGAKKHRSLNIYAVAPVLRFYLAKTHYFDPYVELSIGPSYLTKTRFADRNLGMHFAFQDELGFGASFGEKRNYYASLSALHYSNGSMCSMNAGITAIMMLNIGYRM